MKKFLINFVIYIVMVAAIMFGLPRVLSWALNTPYPMAAITSGSMWPFLKEGDLVLIQGIAPEALAKGDIVVYRNKLNTLTIHRVVKIEDGKLTTKGDANFDEDAPVPLTALVGRALNVFGKPLRIPYLGSITVFASNLKPPQAGE